MTSERFGRVRAGLISWSCRVRRGFLLVKSSKHQILARILRGSYLFYNDNITVYKLSKAKFGNFCYFVRHPFNFVADVRRHKKRNILAVADGPHSISFFYQFFNDVGANKAGTACNEYFG